MKKVILFSMLGILLVAGVSAWAFQQFYLSTGNTADEINPALTGKVTKEEMEQYRQEGKNPFGEVLSYTELEDAHYQLYLHGMSHQKVIAEEKWFFYEMNDERIQWLLNGLDQADLKHEDMYRKILEKWKAGNFATADKDHNLIWGLQEGTVGRATGVFSPEQEQEFLDEAG